MHPSVLPKASNVTRFHDQCLAVDGWPATPAHHETGLWYWIETNHRFNCSLWAEEDLARRTDVPEAEIAANKRAIDRFNQARNDAVESMDETLLVALFAVARKEGAWLSSETAGSMIDRLSILSLKLKAMFEQTLRTDVGADHLVSCRQRHARLAEQRSDLAACLDRLLAESAAGTAYFKVYRQFKMYNDPALNPQLYAIAKGVPG